MRIWSVHPAYLDTKGLIALWRETLLAKHVLEGKTKGYTNHPQLDRFKQTNKPLDRINQYLAAVYTEATARGYHFDKEKINWDFEPSMIPVTTGQIQYETEHLRKKLKLRDKKRFDTFSKLKKIKTHPIFTTIKGDVEKWEKI